MISIDPPAIALGVEKVGFLYQRNVILHDICLNVVPGEIVALLGPSGCGKTTLLKLVAGLLAPAQGCITIGKVTVADASRGTNLPPEKRGIGMVFQDYALWPHMSVARNIAFPLEQLRVPSAERRRRAREVLEHVGLAGYEARRPGELSGGQQQRVALARAIVGRPTLVLFDEPLSNLDQDLRATLAEDISDLMRSQGLTGLYVTHDQAEAFAVARRIAIMQGGSLVQVDTPAEIVKEPATVGVAEFLSLGTIVDARRSGDRWRAHDSGLDLCTGDVGPHERTEAKILLRHGAVQLCARTSEVPARVLRSTFTGYGYRLKVGLGETPVPVEVTVQSDTDIQRGSPVNVRIDSSFFSWF